MGRSDHRRRPQRTNVGSLSRQSGTRRRRPREAPRHRRRRRDGGNRPRLPILSLQLPPEPPPPRSHPVRTSLGRHYRTTNVSLLKQILLQLMGKGTRSAPPRLEAPEKESLFLHTLPRRALSSPRSGFCPQSLRDLQVLVQGRPIIP